MRKLVLKLKINIHCLYILITQNAINWMRQVVIFAFTLRYVVYGSQIFVTTILGSQHLILFRWSFSVGKISVLWKCPAILFVVLLASTHRIHLRRGRGIYRLAYMIDRICFNCTMSRYRSFAIHQTLLGTIVYCLVNRIQWRHLIVLLDKALIDARQMASALPAPYRIFNFVIRFFLAM